MPAPNWAVGASRKSTKRVLQAYALSASSYGLNQLRYDLRKMKAHGPTATRRQAATPIGLHSKATKSLSSLSSFTRDSVAL
jgi:hypothetical protein